MYVSQLLSLRTIVSPVAEQVPLHLLADRRFLNFDGHQLLAFPTCGSTVRIELRNHYLGFMHLRN